MKTLNFLTGAAVGLMAGLLLAPEKGEDLRTDIAESAEKWKRKLYKLAGKTGTELSDLKEILEDEVNGLSDDIRLRILTMLKESGDSAKKIKKNVTAEL